MKAKVGLNISGQTNLWQNFGRIFPEVAKKGPNI
jgi:hypothetical protein